jgi:hypothetical protein
MKRDPKLPLVHARQRTKTRNLLGGCHVCSGHTARWTKANAQALAAQHHDRTGHATWVTIAEDIQYGRNAADPRQTDIEDAIASASSGDAPECAPLTDPDAPTVAPVDVSASIRPPSRDTRSRLPAGACT